MNQVSTVRSITETELHNIFTDHSNELLLIKKFSDFALDNDSVMQYFTESSSSYIKHITADLFSFEKANKELDASYWNKVIKLSNILQVMPAKDRIKLNEQIEKKEIVFSKQNVLSTIGSLLLKKDSFLADKVAGIFQALSRNHVSNSPMAFKEKMITPYAISIFKSGNYVSYSTDYKTCEIINDLRQTIADFNQIKKSTNPDTRSTINLILKDENMFGHWVSIDGGAIRIKIHKSGTAHIEVHADIALKLNEILSSVYPNVIPESKFETKKSSIKSKHILRQDVLSFETLNSLTTILSNVSRTGQSVYLGSVDVNSELTKVMLFLGGAFKNNSYFFENDISDLLKNIIVSGCLPDKVSHQFYPTKKELARKILYLADIANDHLVLEPSAGHGALAILSPNKKNVTCVEVNKLNCDILKAKGFDPIEDDFLEVDLFKNYFDRVVMNPPFHLCLDVEHIVHAISKLKPEGILVAVMTANHNKAQQIAKLNKCEILSWEIVDDAFDDTNISVGVLKLVKL